MNQSTAEGGKPWRGYGLLRSNETLISIRYSCTTNLTEGMEERGSNIKVFCPFHGYQSEEPTLSFTVTEDNTKFRCFASGCDASGNGVDFVARLEGLDSFRDAAVLVQERFLRSGTPAPREAERPQRTAPPVPVATKPGHLGSKKSERESREGEHGKTSRCPGSMRSWIMSIPIFWRREGLVEISSVSLASGTIRARA